MAAINRGEIRVLENFVPPVFADTIEQTLFNPSFSWWFNTHTIYPEHAVIDERTEDFSQFIHAFILDGERTSPFSGLVETIGFHVMLQEGIDTQQTLRIKANLNTVNPSYPEGRYAPAHVDFDPTFDFVTGIYYVNDSDGDTIFAQPKTREGAFVERMRYTPKKGTLVLFDGHTWHTNEPPRRHKYRSVINFNWKVALNG